MKKKKSDHFTTTEVGTMLENIDSKLNLLTENHTALDKRLEKVEIEVHGNSRRLDMVEMRLDIVDGKVGRLEDATSKLSKELKETKAELKADIQHLGDRLSGVETRR